MLFLDRVFICIGEEDVVVWVEHDLLGLYLFMKKSYLGILFVRVVELVKETYAH